MGVFARMMEGLASKGTEQKTIMIDATYLKRIARLIACGRKRGSRRSARAFDRADQRWVEHQAARRHGRQGTSN